MIEDHEIQKIKSTLEQLLSKISADSFNVTIHVSDLNIKEFNGMPPQLLNLSVTLEEPRYLIGQNGQTLLDLERVAKMILCRKLQRNLPIALDINNYKKKKIDYLKTLARNWADEVSLTQRKKFLPPMPSYQRRIIHTELADRWDVTTQSEGEDLERCVVITPSISTFPGSGE